MTIDVWEITPHQNSAYDSCIIPVRDDPEGRRAIQYAKDALEFKWDTADSLEEFDVTVRVRKIRMHEEDIPEAE